MKIKYVLTTMVFASQPQPKSTAAAFLLGSTSANYQINLGRFMERLVNCQVHKYLKGPRSLGIICQHVLSDYRVIFNADFEKFQDKCKIANVPCFPLYSGNFVIHSLARNKLSFPSLYYFYVTTEA